MVDAFAAVRGARQAAPASDLVGPCWFLFRPEPTRTPTDEEVSPHGWSLEHKYVEQEKQSDNGHHYRERTGQHPRVEPAAQRTAGQGTRSGRSSQDGGEFPVGA